MTPAHALPNDHNQLTNHHNPDQNTHEGIPMTVTDIRPQPPSTTASFGTALAVTPVVLENSFAAAPTTTSEDWQAASACRTVPGAGELFFSEELQDIAAAKRVCAECPVIAPCLEGAIGRGEPWGVWGGQLFLNGRILANKRRRGRPPKNPRPEDQIPDVPIPEHLQRLIA